MKNPKMVAAAITAVAAYIRMEEEAIALQLMHGAAYKPPPERFSPWQLSGRQAQMQMRTQMQLKAYHR
jgi:hypothetical protein